MKFPVSMLREFVETSLSDEAIGDLLTMAGFELEGIETVEGEPVLEIKTMANRGDGLSVYGLAREVLAKDGRAKPTELYHRIVESRRAAAVRGEVGSPQASVSHSGIRVEIATPSCSRYACRLFEGISNVASPEWLQKRLRQSGMRPISLVVDLTNYVNLELGQPMHAFDADRLSGQQSPSSDATIVVRQAQSGERIVTLDGVERELTPDMLVISDARAPVAVAGVMGSAHTECSSATRRVLLESAHFDPGSVRRTRKALGLSTEASYRFERWVDPEGATVAIERFTELLELATGERHPNSPVVDLYPTRHVPREVQVRMSRSDLLLGMRVEPKDAKAYLERLGFGVRGEGEPFGVTPPSWRPDVVREEDVVEEIGRVHGYDKIPESLPQGTTPRGGVFDLSAFTDSVREAMLRLGFAQMVSHTIRERSPLDFTEDWRIVLKNPPSPEQAFLRDSVLPCLADAAKRNGAKDLHLFEIGRVFVKGEVQFDESVELGVMSMGALEPAHWSGPKPDEANFFSLKGDVERMCRAVGVHVTFDHPRDPDRRFHPTRQAGVLGDDGKLWVGTIGQIHPDVAEAAGLPQATVMAELDLFVLYDLFVLCRKETHFQPISRNPAIRRDISFYFPKTEPFAKFEAALREACGELLEDLWMFDLYEGPNIPEGHRNVAVAMQLRAFGENLTDEEANRVRDRAVAALEALGATLR